ncbi:hypothetical protein [Nocardia transvalensis]|uniref:hypothetical protein n=1 Tax=Nocardia transvalensis TaxID=37333 RepID=UPI001893D000|nr:hypothetical protein [Nocardia transvalensis]MBF6328752.1 hypothetical protein [Nocardia transvalensis]
MARTLDPREFVRVHSGMPEHPKVEPLSDSAFRALVEAWCLCRRSRNDGRIPLQVWTRRWKAKARKELIDTGLVYLDDDAAVVHDWLEHQPSADELDQRRTARAEAGRKGGQKSGETRRTRSKPGTYREANASGEAKQTPKQNGNGIEPDSEIEIENSGHLPNGTYETNPRDDDATPHGPAVDGHGWKLVRQVIPDDHPHAVRTDLAIRAGALLKTGTAEADVRQALSLWLDKPKLGPGVLPSLVSEVVRVRTRSPTASAEGAATSKARGWLELGAQLDHGPPSAGHLGPNPHEQRAIQ